MKRLGFILAALARFLPGKEDQCTCWKTELVRQEQRHRSRTRAQMLRHLEAQFYGD